MLVTSSLSCDFLIIHRYKFRRINEIYIQIHTSFISRVEKKKSPTGITVHSSIIEKDFIGCSNEE